MFQKSIRFKIVLWYMLVLTLTLSVFSWLVYQYYSHSLSENLEELLKSKAGGVANSIDTYWEGEKIGALENAQAPVAPAVFNKRNNINFAKIARHCIEDRSGDPTLMNILVKIFDADGQPIVSSNDTPDAMFISLEAFRGVLKGKSRFDHFTAQLPMSKPLPLRVFTSAVIEDGKVAYIVQVAIPLTQLYLALNRLKAILFLLLPLTVFLTGTAGAFLAQMTLNPVEEMIKTIRQIKADNLKLRVKIPNTNDEIRRLADTFNDMLFELDRSFSTQRQFLQDVSHELKTPLTILKGEMEVTLKKVRSTQEYEEILLSSLEEIDKIGQIIGNLLMLAKLEIKETPRQMTMLGLNMTVKEIIDDMDVLAKQKNIKINFWAEEKIHLAADENQVRQLFINLLDNAIKYTPAYGSIFVNLTKDKDTAQIKIRDTGMGIPQEDQPFIFDRFYRVDKARSSPGFGLGLSIVKSIVEVHHGRIQVESHPAQGAVFTVNLPLEKIKFF